MIFEIFRDANYITLLLLSFSLSLVFVVLGRSLPRLSGRPQNLSSVQSMHDKPTPRVGGVAIFAALGLSVAYVPLQITTQYTLFMISAALLFAVGLLEDLGFGITPRKRLLAAIGASLFVVVALGVWLPRADTPGLDSLMQYWFVAIPLTLFITAGVANGFNLIDGVNGLAALTAIAAALALSQIAEQAGYTAMVHLALMLAASILGFFVVNYPFGWIFLGDAGAYTLGFILSWFGIAILHNAPDATPWAILLVVFWPVADTSLAIYRRSKRRRDAMAPDKLHVHQMVKRAVEICVRAPGIRQYANPLSTLILAPFVLAPPAVGVIFWNQPVIAFAANLMFAALFFASYSIAPQFIRLFRRDIRD